MAQSTEPDGLDGPARGQVTDPSLRLDFIAGVDLDTDGILRDAREDLTRGKDALEVAGRLLDERDRLEAWVKADPRNGELLFSDPEAAVAEALPGFGELKLSEPGRELFKRLLREHPQHKIGPPEVTKADPAVANALRLLTDVATEALSSTGRYADLTADPETFVGAVAAGNFSADAIDRVVEAVCRGAGITRVFHLDNRAVHSDIWQYVSHHPGATPH
jgi:hypothetical protein